MPAPGDGANNDGTGPGSNNSSNSSRSSPSRSNPSPSRSYGPSPATNRSGTPSRSNPSPSRSYGPSPATNRSGTPSRTPSRSITSEAAASRDFGTPFGRDPRAARGDFPTRGMNIEAMRQQAMTKAAVPAVIGLINPLAGIIAHAFLNTEDDYGYENPGIMGFFDGSFAKNVMHEPGKAPYSLDTPPSGDDTRGGESPADRGISGSLPSSQAPSGAQAKSIIDLLNELHDVNTGDMMQRLRESLMSQDETEDNQKIENPITANAALDFKDLQTRQELVRQRIANHQKLFNTVR